MLTDNDDDSTKPGVSLPASDAHGRAALLLVESLIYGLCEKAALNGDEAIDIVETTIEVQLDQAEAAEGDAAPLWQSHALLTAIAASLRTVGHSQPARPRSV